MDRIEAAPAANGGGRPPTMTAVGSPAEDDEPRSASDIASRSIRLTLGGRNYVMPVLFIAGNERWRVFQDELTSSFVDQMAGLGNDGAAIAAQFAREPDMWLDLLYAYDTDFDRRPGVLPPRDELKETIFEDEPGAAIREVVKAANPKAAEGAARMMAERATSSSSPPTSGRRRTTAGRSKKSAPN